MNTSIAFLIPAGTLVKTRNINRQLRLRPHLTRQDLRFDQIYNTGDGGHLLYFKRGNWLIAVDAHLVLEANHFTGRQEQPGTMQRSPAA